MSARAMLAAALTCGVLIAGAQASAETMKVHLGTGSSLWLTGTSTLHDYESRTDRVVLTVQRDPSAADPEDAASLAAALRASAVRGVGVDVPVISLRSEKAGLDKNLWRTLQAAQHPTIRCRLNMVAVTAAESDTLPVRAEGTLEVAGVVKPVTLRARAIRAADGVWLEGDQPLLMSAFGIKPPTMMLGTLRVGDRVVVHYHLLLVPGAASASGNVID